MTGNKKIPAKKRQKYNFNNCPSCGGKIFRLSGFLICKTCNHRLGSGGPGDGYIGGERKYPSMDQQEGHPRIYDNGRRTPLKF